MKALFTNTSASSIRRIFLAYTFLDFEFEFELPLKTFKILFKIPPFYDYFFRSID